MQWVHWYSRKHNDGRRASGVGWNSSRWHLTNDPDGLTSLCGREVRAMETYHPFDDDLPFPSTRKDRRGEDIAVCGQCRAAILRVTD